MLGEKVRDKKRNKEWQRIPQNKNFWKTKEIICCKTYEEFGIQKILEGIAIAEGGEYWLRSET